MSSQGKILKRSLSDARELAAPGHFDTKTYVLQHKDDGGPETYWVGLSYFLPGGGAEMSASEMERVYIVTSGRVTLVMEDGSEVELGPMDTAYIPPGVKRKIINKTREPATMLFVATYPKSH